MRLLKIFLILICFTLHCSALELKNPSNLEKISLEDVRSLILASDTEIIKTRSFINADGVILLGVEMPENSKSFIKKIEKKFLGRAKDLGDLKNEIFQYFNENGLDVQIEVPPQRLHEGTLKLVITRKFLRDNQGNITAVSSKDEVSKREEADLKQRYSQNIFSQNDQIEILKISLKNIDALILVEDPDILKERSFINANGILIVKAFVPGKKGDFVKKIQGLLNSSHDLSTLKNEIVKYFAEKNYDVNIDIPIQKFNQRILKLIISSKEKNRVAKNFNENVLNAKDPEKKERDSKQDTAALKKPLDADEKKVSSNISLKEIKALILTNDFKIIKSRNFFNADGVILLGVEIPGDSKSFIRKIEKNFLGQSKNIEDLKNEIFQHFNENGLEAVIEVPSQKFNGVLKVVITKEIFLVENPNEIRSRAQNKAVKEEIGIKQSSQNLKQNPEEKLQASREIQTESSLKLPLKNIEAVVLVEDPNILQKRSFINAKGILILNAFIPGKEGDFVERVKGFLNSSNDFSDLEKEIKKYFAEKKYEVSIDLPAQKFNQRILKLIISSRENRNITENTKANISLKKASIAQESQKEEPKVEEKQNAEIKQNALEENLPLESANIVQESQKEEPKAEEKQNPEIKQNALEANLPLEKANTDKESPKAECKIEEPLKTEIKQNIATPDDSKHDLKIEPQDGANQSKTSISKISLKNIQAVVLVKDPNIFKTRNFFNSKGVLIVGALIPGKKSDFVERIEGFLNSSDEFSDLEEEIKNYFAENNFDVSIELYTQKFNQRTLKLIVSSIDKNVKDGKITKIKQSIKENNPAKAVSKKKKEKIAIKKDEIKTTENKEIKAPLINAIVLSSEKEESTDEIKGVVVKNIDIPSADSLKEKLAAYLDKPMNKDTIVQIKQMVILHYKKNKRPFVIVTVPEQNISKGILKLTIFESKIGEVCVSGNKYFSNRQYEIGLSSGDHLDEEKLIRNLNFLNRNPFRNVEMIYKEGKEKGTTDIELVAKEIRPIKIYYGAENTGLDLIGRNRFLAGVHLGNLFWSSQVLSYQITKSFSSNAFEAHTVQYTIPCPWKHLIYFYGGYSKVHADIPIFVTAKNRGTSAQASARYEVPLKTYGFYTHNLIAGFDYKKTNNSAEFVELARFGKIVNLTQLYLTYEGNIMLKGYMSSFDLNMYVSPGKWLPHQTNDDYRTIRLHSRSDYFYATMGWKNLISFYRDLSLSFFFRCQFANVNLLPSEEFGIGGYNTVRGYDEREANGDHGVLLSTEIRLPSFSIFRYWNKKINDRLQFLGFVDYGKVWANEREVGLPKSVHLLGIGPGLRYVIDPYLALRIDYGWKMHREKDTFFKEKKRKLHFGLNVSF